MGKTHSACASSVRLSEVVAFKNRHRPLSESLHGDSTWPSLLANARTGLIDSGNFARGICFQRGVFPFFLRADIPLSVSAGCVNASLLPTDSCSVFLATLSNLSPCSSTMETRAVHYPNVSAAWESGSRLHIFVMWKADADLG